MIRRGAVTYGVVAVLSGCVYYNALYNAERLLAEGEALHRIGRDSLAAARYQEVVRKASGGFRREPDGEWAGPALLLIGRAHLRLGDLRAARVALAGAAERGPDASVRTGAALFLGAVLVESGDFLGARTLLDGVVLDLEDPELLAEALLWRGRARLRSDDPGGGWLDLGDAGALHPGVGLAAALEEVRSGLALGDPEHVTRGVRRLLATPDGGEVADSVAAMVGGAAGRWGSAFGIELLAGLDGAAWSPAPRSRIRLTRARLLGEAGDAEGAADELRSVAAGRGGAAVRARVLLARETLAAAQDLVEARAALPLLLPASDQTEAARLIDDVEELEALAEAGLSDPLAWFAAGEIARDRLGSGALARGFFLAYADAAPTDPWAAKSLLAALDMTEEEGGRAWLRGRLEGRADSPYVLAASGEPAPGLEELEEELAARLQGIRTR